MPRQPRLGAPGVLHDVLVWGLKRRAIFRDDVDRADFVARLAALVPATGLTVYAAARHGEHAVPPVAKGVETVALVASVP